MKKLFIVAWKNIREKDVSQHKRYKKPRKKYVAVSLEPKKDEKIPLKIHTDCYRLYPKEMKELAEKMPEISKTFFHRFDKYIRDQEGLTLSMIEGVLHVLPSKKFNREIKIDQHGYVIESDYVRQMRRSAEKENVPLGLGQVKMLPMIIRDNYHPWFGLLDKESQERVLKGEVRAPSPKHRKARELDAKKAEKERDQEIEIQKMVLQRRVTEYWKKGQ